VYLHQHAPDPEVFTTQTLPFGRIPYEGVFAPGSTLFELVAGATPFSESSGPKSDDKHFIKPQILRQHEVGHGFEDTLKKPDWIILLVVVIGRCQDAERFRGNGAIQ
jgi:hypothetical protein